MKSAKPTSDSPNVVHSEQIPTLDPLSGLVAQRLPKQSSVDLRIEDGKRRSFTNTANSFSLSGFDSRHGLKERKKKNNAASMAIREGHNFVTAVAKKHLKMIHFKGSMLQALSKSTSKAD
ncbi:hypothetical protein IQ216_09420 [Cyanobium sp. LEGE 06143]|nr:hypothetical protein [Cyanobium sp. LEGE 06143]